VEDEEKGPSERVSSADPRSPSSLGAETGPEGRPPRANYRLLFALVWIVAQATLVITAERRIDGAFGFRMFSESSSIKLALAREVDGPNGKRTRIHVDDGVWSARAGDGTIHRLSWYDRVPMPYWIFDQEMHASYGARTQLSRLAGALDDLASHIPVADDLETHRFILDVTVRRNGRDPIVHQLTSRERPIPSHVAPSSASATHGSP
jgi:hypothetical protein